MLTYFIMCIKLKLVHNILVEMETLLVKSVTKHLILNFYHNLFFEDLLLIINFFIEIIPVICYICISK